MTETTNAPVTGAETEQQNVASNGQTVNTEQKPKTLGDILPGEGTNLVYVSGMLQGVQVNCEGPIEYTRKLTRPQWPFIPALPQYDPSKCKEPKFNWGKGEWEDESEETKEKQLADLTQKVESITANVGEIQKAQETAAQEKAVDDKKDDQVLKLVTAMNVQLGTLNAQVQKVLKPATNTPADTKPAQSTTPDTQPTGSTTEGGAQ